MRRFPNLDILIRDINFFFFPHAGSTASTAKTLPGAGVSLVALSKVALRAWGRLRAEGREQ